MIIRSFSFVLLLTFKCLQAQNLPPIGAHWCYWQEDGSGNPYLASSAKLVAVSDTFIDNSTYRKINRYAVNKIGEEIIQDFYLLTDSNGYVYYLRNGAKGLLFNFNAQVNDSIEVDVFLDDQYPLSKKVVLVTDIVTDSNGIKTFVLNGNAQIKQRIINRWFFQHFITLDVFPAIPEGWASLRTYTDSAVSYGDTSQPCVVSPYISFLGSNAQWYYSLWRENEQSGGYFYRVRTMQDTTITNKLCKVVQVYDSYALPIANARYYLLEEDKKVFVWQGNHFKLLYDFGAQVGDTVTSAVVYHPRLRVFETHNQPTMTEVRYVINNIRVVGGRKFWDVTYLDSGWQFSDAIMEGIGSWLGFFGGPYATSQSGIAGSLRCYFNGTHGLNYGNSSQCDKILSVLEHAAKLPLKMYPNPVTDIIYVPTHLANKQYMIYSAIGQLIQEGFIAKDGIINIQFISKGMYTLRIVETNQTSKFLK
jgi:hypothetical protein